MNPNETARTQPKKIGFFKRSYRAVISALKAYFILVGISATIMPLLIMGGIWFMSRDRGGSSPNPNPLKSSSASKPGYLHIQLEGDLGDSDGDEGFSLGSLFASRESYSINEFRTLFRRAAKDEHIKGVFIDLRELNADAASLSEFRRQIEEFKLSQKPVAAYTGDIDNDQYYLLSAAHSIGIPEAAGITMMGPTFQLMYFGDALSKLGLEFEVIRAGKYKSAFEPFVANQPSAETLEAYGAMEQAMRQHLIEAVSVSRATNPDLVAQWFKQGLFSAQAALNAKIIDAISSKRDYIEELEKKWAGPNAIDWQDYLSGSSHIDKPAVASDNDSSIAVIEAMGEIHMSDGGGSSKVITPESIGEELRWAEEEPDVKAVVMRVSSPGGSATASELIWADVAKLAAKKPVIVSMGRYAASGGYYISAPASKIFAEANTITGSIGVIGGLMKGTGIKEKWGVSFHVITQSDRAKLVNPGERASAADKVALEGVISKVYDTFLQRVSEGRKLELAKVAALAQGRVYTGSEALALGLVDGIGGIGEAFAAAKEAAGLDPTKLYAVQHYEGGHMDLSTCLRSTSNAKRCLQKLRRGSSLTAPTKKGVRQSIEDLPKTLQHVADITSKEHIWAVWGDYWAL